MVNLAYFLCGQAGLVPLAIGKPGVAKTCLLIALAKALNLKLYILTGSIREPADVAGYPTLVEYILDGVKKHCMEIVPPKYVVKALQEPHLLFIDELTCCHPGTQSAMLAIAAERRVGDEYLPADMPIFAACNPPGTAANGYPLEATMANRLVHLNWIFPRDSWLKGMRNGLNFPDPQPPVLPTDWKKHIVGVSSIIAEFHERVPDFLEPNADDSGELTLSTTERSGAFPTPRTWTMASKGMAAARSIDAGQLVEEEILRGCVGYAAAEAYYEYADNLDLPDPEPVLARISTLLKATDTPTDETLSAAVPSPDRPDKVRAFLGSVTNAILINSNADRWKAGEEIFRQNIIRHEEIAIASCGPFYRARPQGVHIDPSMTATVNEVIPASLHHRK